MSYIDGFVIAVPTANKQKFIEHANTGDSVFIEYGATRVVECWGDDVPDGKLTDFRRAVKAQADEKVVFSFMEWPSREVCDAAAEKMKNDDCMKPPEGMVMPFDPERMIYGGFTRVVTLQK